jgi:hypothetical protein
LTKSKSIVKNDPQSCIKNLATLNLLSTGKIFLSTKSSKFKINSHQIDQLINLTLSKNVFLSKELEILFSKDTQTQFNNDKYYLLQDSLKYSIDYEFIMNLLWKTIYDEPIVMKFISLRNSNYINILNSSSQKEIENYLLSQQNPALNENQEQQTFFPVL